MGHLENGGAINSSFTTTRLSSMTGEYVGVLLGKCSLTEPQSGLGDIYFPTSDYPFGRAAADVGSGTSGDCYTYGVLWEDARVFGRYENFLLNFLMEHRPLQGNGLGWTHREWGRLGEANVYPCINGLPVGNERCEGGDEIVQTPPGRVSGFELSQGGDGDGEFRLSWAAFSDPTVIYKVERCDASDPNCRSDASSWTELGEVEGRGRYEVVGQDYGDYIYRVQACYRYSAELLCYESEASGASQQTSDFVR